MRLTLATLLLLTLALSASMARGEPEDPAPGAAAELKSLDQAYKEARSAYYKAASEQRAQRKQNPNAELPALVHPDPEYAAKFREAAKRHAGTETSTTLLIRALGLCYRSKTAAPKEILHELLEEHMKSEQLPAIASKLLIGSHPLYLGRDTVRNAMSRIIDESPHDAVKAAFLYARGSLVNRSRTATAEERAAAVKDLDRAVELGADTPYAERAKAVKHELLHLQVGLPAPEIEGKDLDGVAFKLSDYRGKVVVLDFWGDW